MSQPTTPLYRLRELIYAKYGEDRFAIGCEITARWVAFETGKPCSMEDVQVWCNILTEEVDNDASSPIATNQMRALQQLFGVTNCTLMFTDLHAQVIHVTKSI